MSDEQPSSQDRRPELPSPQQRMPVRTLDPPHPSTLDQGELLARCELRTQRRSGPGGQHRNKTSSGAFLTHRPTGIVAEATERRSQADNRRVAFERLRLRLALECRTPSLFDDADDPNECAVREQYGVGRLRISPANPAKPAVLALLLNDLHASGGQPSSIAALWNTTTSDVIRFLKTYPPAFAYLNQIREFHGRRPLK